MVKSAVHINHARWENALSYGNEAAERFHEKCWVRRGWIHVTFSYPISFPCFFLTSFPLFIHSSILLFLLSPPHFPSSFTFHPSPHVTFSLKLEGKNVSLRLSLAPRQPPSNTLCWLVCAGELHNCLRFPGHMMQWRGGECKGSSLKELDSFLD